MLAELCGVIYQKPVSEQLGGAKPATQNHWSFSGGFSSLMANSDFMRNPSFAS
jgi:hypothetical protein